MAVAYTHPELRALSGAYENFSLLAPPRPIRGVRLAIPKMAEEYRLAILCDTGITSGRVLRNLLAQDGLLPLFQVDVFSDEAGRTKPHIDNFRAALRKLRAKPHEAVHLGDLIRTDIRGALGAGMQAILFAGITRYAVHQLRRQAQGIPVVDDFCRVPDAVRALENARKF